MNVELDEELIYRVRRRSRKLGPNERIAINLLLRRDIKVAVLARVFKVSKNTIYGALGYQSESYPHAVDDAAAETEALIDKIGFDVAYKKYVTPAMIEAVNRENRIEADARAEAQARRRAAE